MSKDMLLGSEAIALGVKLAKPKVIPAYPITPQTHIIETLSEMIEKGELKAKFIRVESELSAAAAAMGASSTGVRTFTATSSHGLALMHEVLHWIVGARLPVVLVNANRAIGSPWNIWTDQTDSMSQRDLGWLQVYCETAQEALDSILQAFYVAERVLLPFMVMIDGFILSHTLEVLDIPTQEEADRFLPEYKPAFFLDVNNPMSFGNAAKGNMFYELRKDIELSMEKSFDVIEEAHNRFKEVFGRGYDFVEKVMCDDAEIIFVTAGALVGTTRVAVEALRNKGIKAGLLKIRYFRPFPKEDVIRAIENAKKVVVFNRSVSFGSSGTITQEIKSALYYSRQKPDIYDFIISLGGKEVFVDDIVSIVSKLDTFNKKTILWR
ncbi:transketolase C-terminal domain-containing protein [Hippea jasoniae]|uniref:transketolase C-terminal domain-containing protein n=1 Tax=Hippea jasoniae TaxID=944479 RepID=UPI0005599E76|nr:transketolase C-terminal domain-containing protein [Hippea jasoniae]